MAKIMVIEDDNEINQLLTLHLKRSGHEVASRKDGIHLEDETIEDVDLFLLDVMLPMINGFELIGLIRSRTWAPILMITAVTGESDRIRGLDAGADDYISKPFSVSEVMSRVNAHLRRVQIQGKNSENSKPLVCGDLRIDPDTHGCRRGSIEIQLNPIEFKLLSFFMVNQGRVLSKVQLYEGVWGDPYMGDDNTVMVHIRRLREKIEEEPNAPTYIQTIRGAGYKLVKE